MHQRRSVQQQVPLIMPVEISAETKQQSEDAKEYQSGSRVAESALGGGKAVSSNGRGHCGAHARVPD